MASSAPNIRSLRRLVRLADSVVGELRDAVRRLLRRPMPVLLASLVLAGGMACFLFALVLLHGIVLASPPYAQIERLLHIGYAQAGKPNLRLGLSEQEARDLLSRLDGLEAVARYARSTVVARVGSTPHQLAGLHVDAGFFEVLGLQTALGRGLGAADLAPGSAEVAVLSDALWRGKFAADPAALGQVIEVDGRRATVVGVLPPGFDFQDSELLLPLQDGATWHSGQERMLLGRLAAGQSREAVQQQAEAAIAALGAERRGEGSSALIARVTPLKRWVTGVDTAYFIGFMVLSASLVLVVAVVNVAHLQIAGMAARGRELATRAALGGSSGRLLGGLVLDAALIVALATAMGLALAQLGGVWLSSTVAAAGAPMPGWMQPVVDARVLGWALLAALLVTLLSSLGAALRVRSLRVEATLRGGEVGVDLRAGRGSATLTVVQIALACVLLLSALVSVRLLAAVLAVEPGTRADPARVLSAQVTLPQGTVASEALRRAEAIRSRLAAEPGVEAASVATATPGRGLRTLSFAVDGFDAGREPALTSVAGVDAHFDDTLGFDILAGRGFLPEDITSARPVAIVDQDFVERFLGGEDPIGRHIVLDPGTPQAREVTVVGRTAALHPWTPDDLPSPDLLLPFAPRDARHFTLTLRSAGDPASLAARLPAIVAEVDTDAPLQAIATQAATARSERMGIQLLTQIFSGMAAVGLLLAATGIYATLALGVARRTREIGLRRAIGASTRSLVLSVARGGSTAVALGMLIGCVAGAPLAYGLATQMQNAPSFDGLLFLLVLGTLGAAATLAMFVPVRRALRIAPMEALRQD